MPRLIVRFCRRTFPSPEHPGELIGFIIHQPFHLLMQQQAWERETQVMLARVAANYVRCADLKLLAEAFRDYTSFAVRQLPMMSASDDRNNVHFDRGSRPASTTAVEGLNMVTAEEPDSCSICLQDFGTTTRVLAMPCGHLFHAACLKKWLERSFLPMEPSSPTVTAPVEDVVLVVLPSRITISRGVEHSVTTRAHVRQVIDDDYHAYFDKRSGPASAVAVEGLKMVTAEKLDFCSICLEDLGLAALVLAMPCSHLFHPGCLKKWLERSCSCPLCRFSLPQEH
ncbi:hypothetical protein ZIOFF_072771 [Zingiber officinale]|uniref:RING-type domain-containing protein n=1 Tax=Zingiber officinale TaxID=94328 RepID=A0A8J5CS62_ZINOF|nr:hypothetical protein ZIOFF_072771 [Zingiber officinale]